MLEKNAKRFILMKSKISFKGHVCNHRRRDLIKISETKIEGKIEVRKIYGTFSGFRLEAACRQSLKVSGFGNLEVTDLKGSHRAVSATLTAGTLRGAVKTYFMGRLGGSVG